jgi:hypothetical protein
METRFLIFEKIIVSIWAQSESSNTDI